jgi:hypothetical protein
MPQRLFESAHQPDSRENSTSRSNLRPPRRVASACAEPSRRSPACPAAAIAAAALSTTASSSRPLRPRDLPRGCGVLGRRAAGELDDRTADPELARIEDPLANRAVGDLEHEVRAGWRARRSRSRRADERARRPENGERAGDRASGVGA